MAPTGDPRDFPFIGGGYNPDAVPMPGIYGPVKTISSPNAPFPFNAIPPIEVNSSGELKVSVCSFEQELVTEFAKQVAQEIDKEILNHFKEVLEASIIGPVKEESMNKPAYPYGYYNTGSLANVGSLTFDSGSYMTNQMGGQTITVDTEFLKKEIKETLTKALKEEEEKENQLRLTEKAEAAKTKISRQEFENIIRNVFREQDSLLKEELVEIKERLKAVKETNDYLQVQIHNLDDMQLIEIATREAQLASMNKKLFSSYKKRVGDSDVKKAATASTDVVSIPVGTASGDTIRVTPYKVESIKSITYDGQSFKMEVNKMEDEFDDDLEEEEMEEENGIVSTLKSDSKLVAKRVAARKVVNVARDLLVSMLSAGKTKKEANNIKNTIGAMLQTDDGKAVLSFMLGAMLPMILIQLPEKYHSVAKDMAQEFRVEGMAHFGTLLTDFVTGPAFQTAKGLITSALDEAIDTKEEVKATGVRVVADLKNESVKQDKQDEVEEVKVNHKKNNHAQAG